VLQARDLSKSYSAVQALDRLNLTVEPGQVFALLGANGAGKTTTIHLFLGFLTPSSGQALVDGVEVARDVNAARRQIAYIPEQVELYPELTGRENLTWSVCISTWRGRRRLWMSHDRGGGAHRTSPTEPRRPHARAVDRAMLARLNPGAKVVHAERGAVPLYAVLGTGRFDMEVASAGAGWARELSGAHTPESDAYGIGSFVYRRRLPFHPERLFAQFERGFGDVLRAKGFFWIASRPDWMALWSQAGAIGNIEPMGLWYAALPRDSWPPDEVAEIEARFAPPYGDRAQELVFIGVDLDQAQIEANLDACLLTGEELARGEQGWRHMTDPFEVWEMAEQHAHE